MARFVLLHGFGGVGPDHWLVWLSTELRARGHVARLRKLPSPSAPRMAAWRQSLDERLARIASDDPIVRDERGDPSGELVVVAHSLGTRLWLDHATRLQPAPVLADRVALVVPPRLPQDADRRLWPEVDPPRVRTDLAARHTRVVLSDTDPWWPQLGAREAIADPLGLPVDLIGAAGHVEPADGYGPWPAMLDWCLGERETIGPR
ncbi:MAG: alpha/beta hydrolase [Patulibacter minatonensis]